MQTVGVIGAGQMGAGIAQVAAQAGYTVLLSDVPHMPVRMASEARRFTWLVDVFYDRRVKLIMSAEVPPEALYTDGPLAHEFPRTVSRLNEMQSTQFLALERRTVDEVVQDEALHRPDGARPRCPHGGLPLGREAQVGGGEDAVGAGHGERALARAPGGDEPGGGGPGSQDMTESTASSCAAEMSSMRRSKSASLFSAMFGMRILLMWFVTPSGRMLSNSGWTLVFVEGTSTASFCRQPNESVIRILLVGKVLAH